MTGYIALDNTRSLTILAFRGSRSLRNYVADINFPVVPTDICPGCTVNKGFYQSWLEARDRVLATLKATAASHPSYKVVVVGHSLGGAIAAIAAAELRNGGYPNELYTYGAPRIGKSTVSTYITNQGGNFRVTHYDDPVSAYPVHFSSTDTFLSCTVFKFGVRSQSCPDSTQIYLFRQGTLTFTIPAGTATATSFPRLCSYQPGVLHQQWQQCPCDSWRYHKAHRINQCPRKHRQLCQRWSGLRGECLCSYSIV